VPGRTVEQGDAGRQKSEPNIDDEEEEEGTEGLPSSPRLPCCRGGKLGGAGT